MPVASLWHLAVRLVRTRLQVANSSSVAHRRLVLTAPSALQRSTSLVIQASPASVLTAGYPGIIDHTASQDVPEALSLRALDTPPTVALPPRVEHLLAGSETLIAPLVSQSLDLPLVSPHLCLYYNTDLMSQNTGHTAPCRAHAASCTKSLARCCRAEALGCKHAVLCRPLCSDC